MICFQRVVLTQSSYNITPLFPSEGYNSAITDPELLLGGGQLPLYCNVFVNYK